MYSVIESRRERKNEGKMLSLVKFQSNGRLVELASDLLQSMPDEN